MNFAEIQRGQWVTVAGQGGLFQVSHKEHCRGASCPDGVDLVWVREHGCSLVPEQLTLANPAELWLREEISIGKLVATTPNPYDLCGLFYQLLLELRANLRPEARELRERVTPCCPCPSEDGRLRMEDGRRSQTAATALSPSSILHPPSSVPPPSPAPSAPSA